MSRLFEVAFICYLSLVIFLLIGCGDADDTEVAHSRPRRYLQFLNVTHYFVRVNFKANMVPWNQLFAQAAGFRINWDLPPDSFHPYHHRLHRRDIFKNLETVLDMNGISGFHCVRRSICETSYMAESGELYHKILKMIFRRQSSATDRWHNVTAEDCRTSILTCPFSMLEVSRYTDII